MPCRSNFDEKDGSSTVLNIDMPAGKAYDSKRIINDK
jgi:hypothetical protein